MNASAQIGVLWRTASQKGGRLHVVAREGGPWHPLLETALHHAAILHATGRSTLLECSAKPGTYVLFNPLTALSAYGALKRDGP